MVDLGPEALGAPVFHEAMPTPDSFAQIQGAEMRAFHLDMLPDYGFESGQKGEIINKIVSIGLPVDNITALSRERNEHGSEAEATLGSFVINGEYKGRYSVYELLDRQIAEKQLGTMAHESAHANSPMWAENSYLFGGEQERAEVLDMVERSAAQSLLTGKYLNGYQKYLAEKLYAGEIPSWLYVEETWAITAELALTDRKKLEQTQQAQHTQLDRLNSHADDSLEKVSFITTDSDNPEGIDKALISLIEGISDYEGLTDHVTGLKAKFYPDRALAIAYDRGTVAWQSLLLAQQDYIRQYMDDLHRRQLAEAEMAARQARARVQTDEKPKKKTAKSTK